MPGSHDVMAALEFGLAHDLPIAVRGGGHNVAGKAVCDDGIVIDLSGMKGIRVDPAKRVARAEAGLTWGEFERDAGVRARDDRGRDLDHRHRGSHPRRRHRLSPAEVRARVRQPGLGRCRHSRRAAPDRERSPEPRPSWGLRGGGGNFGIVTSFEYRLHPIGQVLAGPVVHPFSAAHEAFAFYRDYSRTAPDDVAALFALTALPDGQWAVTLFVCYSDPAEESEGAIAPVHEFGSPLEDLIEPMSYREVQMSFDADFPPGMQNYWKSSNMDELSDDAIDTMVAFMESSPSFQPMVFLERFGGAVARVPAEATAFGHRDAAYDLVIASIWSEEHEQEAHIDWAKSFWEAMQPYSTESVYVNYLSEEGEDRVRAAYGGEPYARLVEMKRRYDPENVFRNNQNINPDG